MQWLGLVGFACQSSEENTRGRLKVPGRVGPLRAPVTVEAAEADRTALSSSLYLTDTQSSHTNTRSLEHSRGSRFTGRPSLIPTQTRALEPERLKLLAGFSLTTFCSTLLCGEDKNQASHQVGWSPLAKERDV